jgi:hypothetical protein
MHPALTRVRLESFSVQLTVHVVKAGLWPGAAEQVPVGVIRRSPAQGARPVPGRERNGFIMEEQPGQPVW